LRQTSRLIVEGSLGKPFRDTDLLQGIFLAIANAKLLKVKTG
jgi:hypothetical protein